MLEIGPTKTRFFFQERSGLNTQLHRVRQLAEQLFNRENFYLEVETGKGPVHSALWSAVSNEMLFCLSSWKDAKPWQEYTFPMDKGEKTKEKSSIVICADSFFWEIVHKIHNRKEIFINKLL